MGLRTRWVLSVHVSEPMAQLFRAAVMRVKVTVKFAAAPGASVTRLGVTTVSKPGRSQ